MGALITEDTFTFLISAQKYGFWISQIRHIWRKQFHLIDSLYENNCFSSKKEETAWNIQIWFFYERVLEFNNKEHLWARHKISEISSGSMDPKVHKTWNLCVCVDFVPSFSIFICLIYRISRKPLHTKLAVMGTHVHFTDHSESRSSSGSGFNLRTFFLNFFRSV